MDFFQVSVKEKTRKFMFTVIGQKRKKIRKARITTTAATIFELEKFTEMADNLYQEVLFKTNLCSPTMRLYNYHMINKLFFWLKKTR